MRNGIWEAVKRETEAKYKSIQPGSEVFMEMVGKRFTEVVTKTQVYDSVLSRSANMRSKSLFMNMWTSFMAEPTTSINMLEDALRKAKRGDKRYAAKAIGAVYGSVILNSALVSLVYAMRDDDEDETFLEKYLSRFTTEVLDGINPLTYIPFLKDVWSIMQGFDVERADMILIADLWNAIDKSTALLSKDTSRMDDAELAEHEKAVADSLWGIADTIASLAGIPLKNVRRDIEGVKNLMSTLGKDANGRDTTWGSLVDNVLENVKSSTPFWNKTPGKSKTDKLYDAIVNGDKAYVERLKKGYADEASYNQAVRKALRENDPRVRWAAIANNKGDVNERIRITKEIIAEGYFSRDNVIAAINVESDAIRKGTGTASSNSAQKSQGMYKAEDLTAAIIGNDKTLGQTIKDDMVQTAQRNGKTKEQAESGFIASATAVCKAAFLRGDLTENQTVGALSAYCGSSRDEALADVKCWAFKESHPDVYVDESWFEKYYEKIADSGVEIELYLDYKNQIKGVSGKENRMDIIDGLPISKWQKDVLYLAEGWAESKLYEAPWH